MNNNQSPEPEINSVIEYKGKFITGKGKLFYVSNIPFPSMNNAKEYIDKLATLFKPKSSHAPNKN